MNVSDVVFGIGQRAAGEKEACEQQSLGEALKAARWPVDLTQASRLTPEIAAAIDDAFLYHPWTPEQEAKGNAVRGALIAALRVIVENVPPGPDRTAAIRKLREARMDCNSAITHDGKY